jgi:hypothetical protein
MEFYFIKVLQNDFDSATQCRQLALLKKGLLSFAPGLASFLPGLRAGIAAVVRIYIPVIQKLHIKSACL